MENRRLTVPIVDDSQSRFEISLEEKSASFRLSAIEGDTEVLLWTDTVSLSEDQAPTEYLRLLRLLGEICYSFYAENNFSVEMISEFANLLLNFRRFVKKLED